MKRKVITSVMVLAIMLAAINVGAVFAGAYDTAFTTAITYQNVGSAATQQLEIWFYDSPGQDTPIVIPRPNLAAGAGTSVFVGGLSDIDPGFQGTAIVVADQPMLATLVQVPPDGTPVRSRPLSNGFASGTEDSLIPTVNKNMFGTSTTVFSVQNTGSTDTAVTVKLYDLDSNIDLTINETLKSGAGMYVDAYEQAALGDTWTGSAVVETSGGSIVTSAMESQLVGNGARAFEGVGEGGLTIYMPSALCQRGPQKISTFFAIQNTSLTNSTNVTTSYYDTDGVKQGEVTNNIGPGAKQSLQTCNNTFTGFLGSAVVESTSQPIIVMGKAESNIGGNIGIYSAFIGFESASNNVALPYVRWATNNDFTNNNGQRTYLAIQNIGDTTIAVGELTIQYIDRNGNLVTTHTNDTAIAPGIKFNSKAIDGTPTITEFGYYHPGAGGSAIVQGPSGSELAVIARVQGFDTFTGLENGEDYNGMDMP
jgi:hypothetical protein